MRKLFIGLSIVGMAATSFAGAPAAAAQNAAPSAGRTLAPVAEGRGIVAFINEKAEYSIFASILHQSGLDAFLASKGPFTVFVPSNAAFAGVEPEAIEQLFEPQNKPLLTALVSAHIMAGRITSARWAVSPHIGTTLGGEKLVYTPGQSGQINNAPVAQTDILTSNGVVHVMDAPLVQFPLAGPPRKVVAANPS